MKRESFLRVAIFCLSVLSVCSCSSKEAWKPSIEYTDAPWELPDGGLAEPVNVYRGNPSRDGVISKEPIEYFRQFEPIEALRGNVYRAAQYGDMIAYAAQEKQDGVWGDLSLFLYDQRQQRYVFETVLPKNEESIWLSPDIDRFELAVSGIVLNISDLDVPRIMAYNFKGEKVLDVERVDVPSRWGESFPDEDVTQYLLAENYIAIAPYGKTGGPGTVYRLSDGVPVWQDAYGLHGGRSLPKAGDIFFSVYNSTVSVFDPLNEKVWTIDPKEKEYADPDVFLSKDYLIKNSRYLIDIGEYVYYAAIYSRSGELKKEVEGIKVVEMIGDILVYAKTDEVPTKYYAETLSGTPLWQKAMDVILYVDEEENHIWGGYNKTTDTQEKVLLLNAETGETIRSYDADWSTWGTVTRIMPVNDDFVGFSDYPPQVWVMDNEIGVMRWLVDKDYFSTPAVGEYDELFEDIYIVDRAIIAKGVVRTYVFPFDDGSADIIIHNKGLIPYRYDDEMLFLVALFRTTPTIVRPLVDHFPLKPKSKLDMKLEDMTQYIYGDIAYNAKETEEGSTIYAQNILTGDVLWEQTVASQTTQNCYQCPYYRNEIKLLAYPLLVVTEYAHYIGSYDNRFALTRAFDARDGSLLWMMKGGSDAVISDKTLYLYNFSYSAHIAMDADTFQVKWHHRETRCKKYSSKDYFCCDLPLTTLMIDEKNKLLYEGEDVVDMVLGRVKRQNDIYFSTEYDDGAWSSDRFPQAIYNGVVFTARNGYNAQADEAEVLTAISAIDSQTGALLWKYNDESWKGYNDYYEENYYISPIFSVASEGIVVFSMSNDILYAFDASTGSLLWTYYYPSSFDIEKLLISGKMLLAMGEEYQCRPNDYTITSCYMMHRAISLDLRTGLIVGVSHLDGPFMDDSDYELNDSINIDENIIFSDGKLYRFDGSMFVYE